MIDMNKSSDRPFWFGNVVFIVLLHVICVVCVLTIGLGKPMFWSLALLAYTLGMRHAFDLDHIVFIDNAVRKLVQQKKSSIGVGFYFALGHSLAVLLLVIVLTNSLKWLSKKAPELVAMADWFIPLVSGVLLLAIGVLNLFMLAHLIKSAILIRKNPNTHQNFMDDMFHKGWTSKFFNSISKLINRDWHIVFFGFLFGLSFDTATELSMLSISAHVVNSSLTLLEIVLFPVLFAAGMMLMDMIDSAMMKGAFRWGLSNPSKKLYYNIIVTFIAVSFSLGIGMYKLSESLISCLDWGWDAVSLGGSVHMDAMGYILVSVFMLIWLLAYVVMKAGKRQGRNIIDEKPLM